jgi:chromosome segregation ATPase
MLNHRSTMQKHFSKEVQNLELLIAHIDRVNPYALEQFERRRLKRRGLRARDIEREINQMKKDGRLKVAPAAND